MKEEQRKLSMCFMHLFNKATTVLEWVRLQKVVILTLGENGGVGVSTTYCLTRSEMHDSATLMSPVSSAAIASCGVLTSLRNMGFR